MSAVTRILVVDDDAGARVLTRAALRKSEFEITLAVDGEDAMRQFQAGNFDMVMLDVSTVMPCARKCAPWQARCCPS
jgi:DNA-binding response OmpR family regulator